MERNKIIMNIKTRLAHKFYLPLVKQWYRTAEDAERWMDEHRPNINEYIIKYHQWGMETEKINNDNGNMGYLEGYTLEPKQKQWLKERRGY